MQLTFIVHIFFFFCILDTAMFKERLSSPASSELEFLLSTYKLYSHGEVTQSSGILHYHVFLIIDNINTNASPIVILNK